MVALVDTAFEGNRTGRFAPSAPRPGLRPAPTLPRTNSVTASQARAARRREARRDEQAVAAWLRELAGRTR
jgi:hypothetical protein